MSNLETDRLIMRPVTQRDVPALFALCRTPNVGPNAGWKPHETLEETQEIADAIFIGKPGIWGATLRDTGELIGTIGIIDDHKRQEINGRMLGYSLGEAYWGKGYATEGVLAVLDHGFAFMELDIISAYCYPENKRSQRVLEKCGMVYEGQLRQAEKLYDGQVKDHLCFSVTAEAFGQRAYLGR